MTVINPRVKREDVFNVPDVEFTDTWHPIPHRTCIESVERVTDELNIKIDHDNELYSLSADGHQMYAAWSLLNGDTKKIGNNTLFQCIIFRNATNKYFSFGINGGTNAYVCENLVLFFEHFDEFRRHTGRLDNDELDRVITKGVFEIVPKLSGIRVWHNALHNIKLEEKDTKALAYDAIREKIISQKRIPQFNTLLFDSSHNDESHRYNPKELYGFHGACTELMNDMNMTGGFVEKQNRLHSFIVDRFEDRLPVIPR